MQIAGEEPLEPAGGLHPDDGDSGLLDVGGVGKAHRFEHGHLATGILANETHGRGEVLGADLDPASVDAHEGRLLGGELFELVEGEGRVADGDVPAILDERAQAELRVGGVGQAPAARCAEGVGLGRFEAESRAEARGGGVPPVGRLDGETLLGEDRLDLAQELVGLLGGEAHSRGLGLVEGTLEARVETHGTPEFGEEELLRILDADTMDHGGVAGEDPDIIGVDHQARTIHGL